MSHPDHPSRKGLTFREAMAKLEVSRATLYRLIKDRPLTYVAGMLSEQQVLNIEKERRK